MVEGQNRSINRTHGSTLAISARLWIYTPRFGMRKFEIAQVYYAEDESDTSAIRDGNPMIAMLCRRSRGNLCLVPRYFTVHCP